MNGCHNRAPFLETLTMQDGWVYTVIDGQKVKLPRMVEVKNAMSKPCNYTHTALGQQDKDCISCFWRT